MSTQRTRTPVAAAWVVAAAFFGCSAAEGGLSGSSDGTAPDPGPQPDGGPSIVDPSTSGLPCEVSALLERYCIGCHSAPPIAPAPMPLVRYEDLIANRGSPPRPVAERALERMQEGSMPPAPLPRPSAVEISAFETWVQAKTPRSNCIAPMDAGPTIPNPYDTPLQCSSGRHWTRGDDESPEMHPGRACIACHARDDEGPSFVIGGTVYRTAHEPDDCYGVGGAPENVVVQITDARGQVIELPVNASGNFFYEGDVVTPYSAKVIAGSRERAMPVKQTSGDCNGCHTVNGANGAPGRIMAP